MVQLGSVGFLGWFGSVWFGSVWYGLVGLGLVSTVAASSAALRLSLNGIPFLH